MALPQTVRVKLSSEAAGAISMTPVVAQEMVLRDLVEHILSIAGKDEPRLLEILLRGTLVSGASRFRWTGWEADVDSLRELLATFPDPDPQRPFAGEHCIRVLLRGDRQTVEILREAGAARGIFRRVSFWETLMREIGVAAPAYAGYSYRDRADRYLCELAEGSVQRLRSAATAIRYSSLRDRVRRLDFWRVEVLVARRQI